MVTVEAEIVRLSLLEVLVVLSAAVTGVWAVWSRGSVLAPWRDRVEVRLGLHWWADMLACRLCMSVYLSLTVSLLWALGGAPGRVLVLAASAVGLCDWAERLLLALASAVTILPGVFGRPDDARGDAGGDAGSDAGEADPRPPPPPPEKGGGGS